jgi:hypothetical protein
LWLARFSAAGWSPLTMPSFRQTYQLTFR